jgi:hypothetical protein
MFQEEPEIIQIATWKLNIVLKEEYQKCLGKWQDF